MPILTDLASAAVKDKAWRLFGQTLTRPALLLADGMHTTYACDVNIGPTDPTGRIHQYYNTGEWELDLLTGLPGQPPAEWQLGDELVINTVLRNVAIARGNADLIYADVGSPVELRRTNDGKWEIIGFSRQMPGTYTVTPVHIPRIVLGPIQSNLVVPTAVIISVGPTADFTLTTHYLTLEELGTLSPTGFGGLPFGISAIYIGDEFLRFA